MNFRITEIHLLVHIMHNSPEEYDSMVEADKKMISNAKNPLSIETFKDHLHRKWEKLVQRRKISVTDDTDKVVGGGGIDFRIPNQGLLQVLW